MDRPLSQQEAYKVADWLKAQGAEIRAAMRELWKKRPSEIAKKYHVDQQDVSKAAGR